MTASARFSCCIAGSESLLVQCGEQLLQAGHRIDAVVSADSAIARWAAERDLRLVAPDAALARTLAESPFDYLFSITNLRVLPAEVIQLPRRMAINFHDGPLPRFAGMHATSWAIIERATEYAITWHRMTPDGIDDGDVLWREPVTIDPEDTAFTLNARCYEAGIRSFGTLIDHLAAGTIEPRRQDLSLRTYFGRYVRPRAAASIDWTSPVAAIVALVRALDFGPYPNPLGLAKVWINGRPYAVRTAAPAPRASGESPGTVVEVAADRVTVAAADGDVVLTELADVTGLPLETRLTDLFPKGSRCGAPDDAPDTLARTLEHAARQERFWVRRLASAQALDLPPPMARAERATRDAAAPVHMAASPVDTALVAALRARLAADSDADAIAIAGVLFLARWTGTAAFDVAFGDAGTHEAANPAAVFSPLVPWPVAWADDATFDAAATPVAEALRSLRRHLTFALDVAGRYPVLRTRGPRSVPVRWPVRVVIGDRAGATAVPPALELRVAETGASVQWRAGTGATPAAEVESLARQFDVFLRSVAADGTKPRDAYSLLDAEERRRVTVEWNATARDYPRDQTVPSLIARQAARDPDRVAIVAGDERLSYREVERRASRLARRLQAAGVTHGSIVGLAVPRSAALVIGALAIWKAGAAYLPIDPDYPVERRRFMVEDSGVSVIVVAGRADAAAFGTATLVDADDERGDAAADAGDLPVAAPEDLAYVIYTSGSTGRPKGVLVEHRNVANFIAGMDGCIDADPPGTWLAVTSLSFDISVLELFWTLARGFTVVVQRNPLAVPPAGAPSAAARRPIDLSLFYFASDAGDAGASQYRLLIEGAKFADREGFAAVWTPERHFHAFGGLYPNPSVAGAAVATITTRVGIRAGSVVLPLHHPIRVAEEWALVDNLSGGRVGVSFASGWHPEDFVLRPDAFADAKTRMTRDIETVRRLWRGERVAFPGPLGTDVEVSTLPRPVQAELPIWVTAAGNPDTFRIAGEAGCHLLTHLLGQSLEELADKVALYRRAWRASGRAGRGHVTLMLHTFVGESDAEVRQIVREPMKRYLASAVSLIKQYAWSFPAFRKRTEAAGANTDAIFAALSPEDLDGLVEHAFGRYYETSGLFGTVGTCVAMVDRVKALGIEEVACLIDFGVPHAQVIGSFDRLAELRRRVSDARAPEPNDESIAANVERHGVTHLQCTPTLAGVLAADAGSRLALGRLTQLLVGGEALTPKLASSLVAAVGGRVTNMYGPTETTVWSAVHDVAAGEDPVPVGRPIANTSIYVLDRHHQPVPAGTSGELFIGGEGVARGYHARPELTRERFLPDPFDPSGVARLYRTGDLGRHRSDGVIEFLGRVDHQVKIRGFRIEPGEIEATLAEHPAIDRAVVVAREDSPGDPRLVAYVTPRPGGVKVEADAVRNALRQRLPDHMVPAAIVVLASLPETPNGKVDRQALPRPEAAPAPEPPAPAGPASDLEISVAAIWADVLRVPRVGLDQNFFDLGGHSLLTVQVLNRLRESTGRSLPITDMFRFPTVRALARHLGAAPAAESTALAASDQRAASRRELIARRRAGNTGSPASS
jgi:natural product biosynthesis luciferase-like monooxygenase protein